MRTAFANRLTELAQKDDRIYLLTGDAGYTVFESFKERFPSRYLNTGIAEAAAIGVAAGLALNGKQVFVYNISPFVTMRCFEQVRVDLCYQNLPVKLIGIGGGMTYGPAGMTHHSVEDIAIMSCLPNMTVICPGDPLEAELAVEAMLSLDGPSFLRIGKRGEPNIHPEPPPFEIGRGIILKRGGTVALLATGNALELARNVCDSLLHQEIACTLISMHTVKPLDRELIRSTASDCSLLVTIEEHNIIGGLGSRVADMLTEEYIETQLIKCGIPDSYAACAGDQDYLREVFGLSVEQITDIIVSKIRQKKNAHPKHG